MINNRPSQHEITHTLTIDVDALGLHLPAYDRLRENEIKAITGEEYTETGNLFEIEVVSQIEYTPEDPRTRDDSGWPEIFECLTNSHQLAYEETFKIIEKITDYKIRLKVLQLLADAICEAHKRWVLDEMEDEARTQLEEQAIDYADFQGDALHEERRERGHVENTE